MSESLARIGGHIGYSVRPAERKKGYATKILELVQRPFDWGGEEYYKYWISI